MKFGLTQETNLDQDRSNIIISLSNELKEYFKNRDYGKDVEEFLIGLISVKPEFEIFFKERKPKYISHKIETHGGISVEITKSYGYDIKLNYNNISESNMHTIKSVIASEIVTSLSHLDSLPKKIKDFDKERFKGDLLQFFKEHGLL